jgi:hypothetical protein
MYTGAIEVAIGDAQCHRCKTGAIDSAVTTAACDHTTSRHPGVRPRTGAYTSVQHVTLTCDSGAMFLHHGRC